MWTGATLSTDLISTMHLLLYVQPALLEFVGQGRFVDRLEEPWPEGDVDLVGGIDDLSGDLVLGHGGLRRVCTQRNYRIQKDATERRR